MRKKTQRLESRRVTLPDLRLDELRTVAAGTATTAAPMASASTNPLYTPLTSGGANPLH